MLTGDRIASGEVHLMHQRMTRARMTKRCMVWSSRELGYEVKRMDLFLHYADVLLQRPYILEMERLKQCMSNDAALEYISLNPNPSY